MFRAVAGTDSGTGESCRFLHKGEWVIGTMETVATLEAAAELAREHDEIDRLATLVSTLSAGPARRAMVLEACSRYAIHAEVEASHLLPAVCRYLPDGAQTAAEETARHQALSRSITAFLRLCDRPQAQDQAQGADLDPAQEPAPDPDRGEDGFTELDEFDIVIGQLVAGIQGHVERQDTLLLPALNRVCPLVESRQIGADLHDALCAARRAQLPGAEPQPRRHGFKALLHCVARALSITAGAPARTG